MQTSAMRCVDPSEIPSMWATLCSYECLFGPYHPQTLCLMTELAVAYCSQGDFDRARPLLERLIPVLGQYLGREHELRLRALAALVELLCEQEELTMAGSVQKELVECLGLWLGSDHLETVAARQRLAEILLMESDPARAV
jgi:hypothetical protein